MNAYDPKNIVKITTKRFGFELYTDTESRSKYSDIAFEEMTALLVRQNVKAMGVFVDVGANHGFYEVLVGHSNPNCKILAFEPVPENFVILRKNLELNKVQASVFEAAVSNQASRSAFQVSEQTGLSGLIANREAGILKEIAVDVVTLDMFLDQIPDVPLLVKIDTEGNELNVLDGMRKLIQTRQDIRLVLELHPGCLASNRASPEVLLDLLDQLGFDVFVVQDVELRYVRYRPGSVWTDYMGERTYRNLFCVKKSQSLNLVFFSHSSGLYGAERRLLELASELVADYGALCTVYVPDSGPLEERLVDIGVSVVLGRYHRWCWWSGNDPGPQPDQVNYEKQFSFSIDWLLHELPELKRLAPDVILTSSIVIVWGAMAATLLNVPHVWMIHEFGELDHGLKFYIPFSEVTNFILSASNKVITNSRAVQKELFGESRATNVETIYYHFGDLYPDVQKDDQKVLINSASMNLLLVGNIIPSKGQEDAVRALVELVNQRNRDVALAIVGSGQATYLDKLRRMVEDAHVQERVHFVPFQMNVRPLFSQADIILVCSRCEAFGSVTVEGLLHGKAVIGTNTGGTPEIIHDGETGLLYEPGNIPQLVSQIERLMEDMDLRKALGERGSSFARETLTRVKFGGRYRNILLTLKSEKNPRSRHLQDLLYSLFILLFASKDQSLKTFQVQLSEKQGELQVLTVQLSEKQVQLSEIQRENKRLITDLMITQAKWVEMQNSLTFYLATRYRSFLDRLLPESSGRRAMYNRMTHILGVWILEGPRGLYHRIQNRQKMERVLKARPIPGAARKPAESGAQLKKQSGWTKIISRMDKKIADPAMRKPIIEAETHPHHTEDSDKYAQAYESMMSDAGSVISNPDYVPLSTENYGGGESSLRAIAFYLPQYHPIPENDEWWGKGFTEWTNVSKAIPQFVGHYQPRLPGELGFYDLRVPEVQRRQIELARQYGIHGFCIHYYWFNGKRLLEAPLEQFTQLPGNDFPFCLCWANENWTRRWDGQEHDILIAQRHSEANDSAFIRDVVPYFRRENYIRVGDRPLLIVYRVPLLPDARATSERWREYCLNAGVGNPYLVAAATFGFSDDPRQLGFDAAVEFPPHDLHVPRIDRALKMLNPNYQGSVHDYRDACLLMTKAPIQGYPLFKTVMPGWDNEARKPGRGRTFAFSTPEAYREWLQVAGRIAMSAVNPQERIVFINAWNEWGEGAYLEPDRRYGYAYLQATMDALKELSNIAHVDGLSKT